jgi:hypothetical protein
VENFIERSKTHSLSIEITTTSHAKIFRKRIKSYIVREPFSVSIKFRNLANKIFPGGYLTLLIAWPNGQGVSYDVSIPSIQPNEEKLVDLGETEALANGFGLIFCKTWKASDGQPIRVFDAQRRLVDPKIAIYSIPVKTWEEIYSFWALIITVASLVIVVIDTFIKAILSFLRMFGLIN